MTYLEGEQGDEVADYTENFKTSSTLLRSVSVNFYDGDTRATDATPEMALEKTVNFTKLVSDITNIAIGSIAERRSITYFEGEQGDEVADYTENFKTSSTLLRSVSVNFYDGDTRATDATPEMALETSFVTVTAFSRAISGAASVARLSPS